MVESSVSAKADILSFQFHEILQFVLCKLTIFSIHVLNFARETQGAVH